ncbi:MAG: imidazole glycerol phosphate synthase subunit HisF [Candidatus Micrarchaeia archaeon]
MLAKRIIPCLDCDLSVPQGRVVKGVRFKQLRYAGVPWELAAKYSREGADEIVFLDITASAERRATMVDVVRRTCEEVFVPITVGGGIRSVEDASRVFRAGADKVSINTAAIKRPRLIAEISAHFGSQACVLAIDCARRKGGGGKRYIETEEGKVWFECSIYGGRVFTGIDALAWAERGAELGAGEILLTSMDRDGTNLGYDIALTRAVSEAVGIPVIASGGLGRPEHALEVLTRGKADAALLAGQLHFGRVSIRQIKQLLAKNSVPVRL